MLKNIVLSFFLVGSVATGTALAVDATSCALDHACCKKEAACCNDMKCCDHKGHDKKDKAANCCAKEHAKCCEGAKEPCAKHTDCHKH